MSRNSDNMNIIEVTVEHSGKNLSAYTDKAPIITVGKDINEIEENFREAIELYLEDNINPAVAFIGNYELIFKIDITSFINHYSTIFTKAALSRITGINQRQLWHYSAGTHKPRKKQLERIEKGIRSLTRELDSIHLL